jgi:catechol 2,3-dioxygenase-like lactoylglutathione lyase family enzyme
MHLNYAIKFVSDMDQAVAFYRDKLGLPLKFHSPSWSEFATGETTLALHPASPHNPAGSVQLGFGVEDLDRFHREAADNGIVCTSPPREVHGTKIARFLDSEESELSVSGPS